MECLSPCETRLVVECVGDIEVPLATHGCLVKPAQNLQCVAKVTAGLGFPQLIPDGPLEGKLEGQTSLEKVQRSNIRDDSQKADPTNNKGVYRPY